MAVIIAAVPCLAKGLSIFSVSGIISLEGCCKGVKGSLVVLLLAEQGSGA
jgi:hypothetical protein